MKKVLLVVFLFSSLQALAQNAAIDSLLKVLASANHDSSKVATLNALWHKCLIEGSYDQGLKYASQVLRLSSSVANKNYPFFKKAKANAYHNIGIIHYYQSNYYQALEYFKKSLIIKEETKDKKAMAGSYSNIGAIYGNQGEYGQAIEYYLKSLKIEEETGDKKGMAGSYNNIGNVYNNQSNYAYAIEYYQKSIKISEEIGDKYSIAIAYNGLGTIHHNQKNYAQAIEYYLRSLKSREETGDKKGVAISYNNIGSFYTTLYESGKSFSALDSKKDSFVSDPSLLDSAWQCQSKAYNIQKEIGDHWGMTNSLYGLGKIAYQKQNLKEALKFYEQAATLAERINAQKELYESWEGMAYAYEKIGLGMSAYEYYKKFISLRDTLQSEEAKEKTVREDMRYEYDKKEALAKAEQDKKDALASAESQKQKLISWTAGGGLFLALSFAFFVVNRLKLTRRQKNIIEHQKILVEDKNTEILDSIRYAKRIQDAILPSMDTLLESLRNGFVIYKPKDVVAGDFYWMEKHTDTIYFAAADCTGHGVPGAMVSVICSNALTRALLEENITDTGKLLDRTREIVINRLARSGEEVKDGMDIALCAIEFQEPAPNSRGSKIKVQYAGANNPLWVIRPCHSERREESIDASLPLSMTDFELLEVKPNKQPIGKYAEPKPFTTHIIELEKGDTIYLFTDGFADQFGGPKGKKFKYAQLKELLLSIQAKTMDEQSQILNHKFEQWKGNLEQVDDVCIIGVRV
jgi:tetratricopeptide (TPR) repeat protein